MKLDSLSYIGNLIHRINNWIQIKLYYELNSLLIIYNYTIFLNDKRIDSFGVSKIDRGLILIGDWVSSHGDISNLDSISANPVLTSTIANRKPICNF